MNFIRRYEGKDGGRAVVPEGAVEFCDFGVVDPLNLFEVDQRRAIGAKHTVEIEEVERAARDVSGEGAGVARFRSDFVPRKKSPCSASPIPVATVVLSRRSWRIVTRIRPWGLRCRGH